MPKLKWTKSEPQQPGWYWIKWRWEDVGIEIVSVEWSCNAPKRLCVGEYEHNAFFLPNTNIVLWAGPISEPESGVNP